VKLLTVHSGLVVAPGIGTGVPALAGSVVRSNGTSAAGSPLVSPSSIAYAVRPSGLIATLSGANDPLEGIPSPTVSEPVSNGVSALTFVLLFATSPSQPVAADAGAVIAPPPATARIAPTSVIRLPSPPQADIALRAYVTGV
jgi:hypothetical protein